MIVIGLDTETTDVEFGDNGRLIEVCCSKYEFDSDVGLEPTLIKTKTWRIDPRCEMNAKAQAVHGISLADLVTEPEFESVAVEIADFINEADALVIHNAAFDCKFVGKQYRHFGIILLDKPMPVFCTMLNGRWATSTGAIPSLGALAFACDVKYDPEKAHSAEYDVDVMMQCFAKGRKWGFFNLKDAQTVRSLQDFDELKHLEV